MSKFEAMCEVMKSENGPVIAGIGGIVLLVGGYYLTRNRYSAEYKNGDKSVSVTPGQLAEEPKPE